MTDLAITQILGGADFKIDSLTPSAPGGGTSSASGSSFGGALSNAIGKLGDSLSAADKAAASVADGTATDMSSVVMQTERASLELQLATQFRNKAVDVYQELFRMQV